MTKSFKWSVGDTDVFFANSFVEFAEENFCDKFIDLFEYFASGDATKDDLILDKNGCHINYISSRKGDDPLVSFCPAGREQVINTDGSWKKEGRQTGKIAKVFKSLISSEVLEKYAIKDADFERLSNKFKAWCDDMTRFHVVSGEEIRDWYHVSKYADGGGTLNNSCMRDDAQQEYLDVYVEQPNCKMLIAVRKEKLQSRALLWEFEDHTFMDRIYSSEDKYTDMMIKHAEEKGYSRLETQSHSQKYILMSGNSVKKHMVVKLERDYEYMPYMDTLKHFYNVDGVGYLTNHQDTTPSSAIVRRELSETGGHRNFFYNGLVKTSLSGFIREEDKATCYISGETGHEDLFESVDSRYVLRELATFENEKFKELFVKTIDDSIVRKDNAVFSKLLEGFIRNSDAIFIERHGDWVKERMTKECEDIHELKQECVYSMFTGRRYHKSRVEYVVAQNGNFDFIPLERREEYLQENLK
jgi:hypothetical protein